MHHSYSFFREDPPENPAPFYDKLDDSIRGMRKFTIISAATNLGIFDACTKPLTLENISTLIAGNSDMCRLVCDTLVLEGLLEKSGEQFKNTPVSSMFLTRGSPYSQVCYLRQLTRMMHDLWVPLEHIVRNGPVQYDKEEFFRDFSLPAMAENALSGRLQEIIRAITSLPGFNEVKRVLDLGGGHGLYAIAISMQRPDISAWVFDLPHVIPVAGSYREQYRAERVHMIPGDFFIDPFGAGYDLIISSSNPSGKSIDLIPKIVKALNNGGYFVNVQSTGGLPADPLQSVEWQLWTFHGVNKSHGEFTKEQAFMTPGYRDALTRNGLFILEEREIPDLYHKDTWVKMVIARKQEI
jgi:hypothetical protein